MRTIISLFAMTLALVVSACGTDPGPSTARDADTPMTDSGVPVTTDIPPSPDTPPSADVPTGTDVATPPPDTTTGPTSGDLPSGMGYNPGPGGNGAIPCMANLSYDLWRFVGGEGTIAGDVENNMWRLSIRNSDVPATINSWTYSVGADGIGRYWNNFSNMPSGVHCWMRIVNPSTCAQVEFQCFAAGVDPRSGGAPMPGSTIFANWVRDL